MKIDNQTHRDFLLQLFSQVQIPGPFIEIAYEVKKAIVDAEILPAPTEEPAKGPEVAPGS